MAAENIAIVVDSPPSTTVVFTAAGTLTAPVAIGTVIGSIQIEPAGWNGALTLSGADEASFMTTIAILTEAIRARRSASGCRSAH